MYKFNFIMKKMIFNNKNAFAFFVSILLLVAVKPTSAQISLTPKDTLVCPGNSYRISASFASVLGLGNITLDDYFGGVVNIGFSFDFYGQAYTQCVISANNFITFNTALANQYSDWTYAGALASGDLGNVAMFPFSDVNMGLNRGVISYQTLGSAPNRKFVVEFCECPLFSCTNLEVTNQLILYEGSNIIEMHIANNPSCPGWNGGTSVEGLRHNNLQDLVPGRNLPNTPWTVTNDGRRFTPNGANAYTIDTTAYNPELLLSAADTGDVVWYEEGNPNPIGQGGTINVTTQRNVNYYVASITVNAQQGGCATIGSSGSVTFTDTSWVHFGTKYDTINKTICAGQVYKFLDRNLFKTGRYDTLFSSTMGCDSFITLNLTVNPLPDVTLKSDRDLQLCKGDSVRIGVLNPEGTTTYQWTRNNSIIPGADQASLMIRDAGTYVLNATTNKNCKASTDAINMTIHDLPEAEISPIEDRVLCNYDTLELSARNPNSGYGYIWEPIKPFLPVYGNDGSKVIGVFLHSTAVTMTVYNRFGCHSTDSIYIETKPCDEIFVPNAFTPNNDGMNDYFKPMLLNGQVLVSLRVYNRLGQMVYDNRNPKKGWDGNFVSGQPAASDTYMYLLEYTGTDHKYYIKKGSVNLLR